MYNAFRHSLGCQLLRERMDLVRQQAEVVQQLFTDDAYHDIVQIMMLFFLDRFKDLSIEEVKNMWNFDLAKTKAGQELLSMGNKKLEKRIIKEEIDRIQELYSKAPLPIPLTKNSSDL